MVVGYENRMFSGGGMVSEQMGVKEIRAPPEILCRYTFDESPTERSVRPSGDTEANVHVRKYCDLKKTARVHTVIDWNPQI